MFFVKKNVTSIRNKAFSFLWFKFIVMEQSWVSQVISSSASI